MQDKFQMTKKLAKDLRSLDQKAIEVMQDAVREYRETMAKDHLYADDLINAKLKLADSILPFIEDKGWTKCDLYYTDNLADTITCVKI